MKSVIGIMVGKMAIGLPGTTETEEADPEAATVIVIITTKTMTASIEESRVPSQDGSATQKKVRPETEKTGHIMMMTIMMN